MTSLCIRSYCGHDDNSHVASGCRRTNAVKDKNGLMEFVSCRCEGMLRDSQSAHDANELKFLIKASTKKSNWITYNIPDPGYAECTACGSPGMSDGLCQQCQKRLEELEK